MTKQQKFIILTLIVATIMGALFTVLASNMFFGDIINMSAGFANATIFVSLPPIAVSMTLTIIVLWVLRTYRHPDCFKRISKLYLIIVIALNGVGVIGCILSGAVVYGTFIGSQPFPGFLIIFLLLNLFVIGCSVYGLLKLKKVKEDTGRVKTNFLYVLKTIGWFLFIVMVFNRLGTLFGMPGYVYLRNLYKTFPFYIMLLSPLALGTVVTLKILGLLNKKQLIIATSAVLGCTLVLWIYTAIMGMNDTGFVSSLSQAMPLERMAAKPLEMLIQLLSYLGVGAALLVPALRQKEEPAQAE